MSFPPIHPMQSPTGIIKPYTECVLPIRLHHCLLFPGQTLPIMCTDRSGYASPMTEGGIFGMVFIDATSENVFPYGVTCFVSKAETVTFMRLKLKAMQRFKILGLLHHKDAYKQWVYHHVKILPDTIVLPHPLAAIRLRMPNKTATAIQTRWPAFIYNAYDEKAIIVKIMEHLVIHFDIDDIPTDATELSYWIPCNVGLPTEKRLQCLTEDTTLKRLQMELEQLKEQPQPLRNISLLRYLDAFINSTNHRHYLMS